MLGYQFNDRALLERALRHASWCNEQTGRARRGQRAPRVPRRRRARSGRRPSPDGAAIPQLREGELSVTRAQVVSEDGALRGRRRSSASATGCCSARARRSPAAGPSRRSSPTRSRRSSRRSISTAGSTPPTRWSTACSRSGSRPSSSRASTTSRPGCRRPRRRGSSATPTYQVVQELGPDHDKRFVVAVTIGDDEWARAVGKSKKEAEQMAAAEAHFRLEGSDVGIRPKR